MTGQNSPWLASGAPRGDEYDQQLAARVAGKDPHGEANFVERVAARWLIAGGKPVRVLDGGCGTGRVGIELARRGFDVIGVDLDPVMLEVARKKAPALEWYGSDLAEFACARPFDVAVLAGNVMIFVGSGREPMVVANIARLIAPNGLLVAGFQLAPGGFALADYDALCEASGFTLGERWSTWDGDQWSPSCTYAVSVHRRG